VVLPRWLVRVPVLREQLFADPPDDLSMAKSKSPLVAR
jgi:hypothetical protein